MKFNKFILFYYFVFLSSYYKNKMNQQLKRQLYLDEMNEYNNYVHKRRICVVSCFIYLSENILKSDKR